MGITLFLFAGARSFDQSETPSPIAEVDPSQTQVLQALRQECDRLRSENGELRQECDRLQQSLEQLEGLKSQDFKDLTFGELETLFTNYPTACKLAEHKRGLPAKNLIAFILH